MRLRQLFLGTVLLATGLIPSVFAQTQAPAHRTPDVIFVPTPQAVVDAMLKLAEVTPSDVVYDLGCGDGVIVATAAQQFGATGVGIDIDPQRVKEANDRIQKAQLTDKVKILNSDLFTTDISAATVVTLYLLPSLNQKLIPKLNSELKPGTRIVSHGLQHGRPEPAAQDRRRQRASGLPVEDTAEGSAVARSSCDRSEASAAVVSSSSWPIERRFSPSARTNRL